MELNLGSGLLVRDLSFEDAIGLAGHADNPRVAATLRDLFPSPYSIDDAVEFIGRAVTDDPPRSFAIAQDGEVVGVVAYQPGQDVYANSAEIGYWLAEPYWGRGIMTEVLKAFTEWVFANRPLVRLFAGVFSSNPASARVLEKVGFEREGVLRRHVYKNGEWLDEWHYAILNPLHRK